MLSSSSRLAALALALTAMAHSSAAAALNTEVGEARDGTISLSGGTGNNFFSNAIYIVPLLAAIILLDFAIFGTFASRSDELNGVSKFFFHAKEGLNIIRNRRRNSYGYQPTYYRPEERQSQPSAAAAAPVPQRVAR